MPLVIVKQDVRILGQGFVPGGKPIQVEDLVAEVMIKEGFAVAVNEDGTEKSEGNRSGQKTLFQLALTAFPENKQQEEKP